jgi:hypothetical protein
MWYLYANKHLGACIVLDKEQFEKQNPCFAGNPAKIKYLNEIPFYEWINDEKKSLQECLCFKYKDFRMENEIRYFYNGLDEYCNIANCIKTVALGAEFCNNMYENLDFTFIEKENIEFRHINTAEGKLFSYVQEFPKEALLKYKGNMLNNVNIGHKTNGNYSPITGNIEINNCKTELEKALLEIKYLKNTLSDKEKIIELLTSKK